MDARELYVSFCRARDDQTVDDAVRNSLGHRMPQQALHHHRPHVLKQSRLARAREICERGVLQFRVRRGCETQRFACPAIDRALELRRRVLSCASSDTPDNHDGGNDGGGRRKREQNTTGHFSPSGGEKRNRIRGDAYLDGKVVDGTSACYARTLGGLRTSGRALERGDAGLQPCDLPLLFFELRALFLYFLMRDCLNELKR